MSKITKRKKKTPGPGEMASRMEKIEAAKLRFLLKNADGPQPITPMDVARLLGMEDEYIEWLFEEELKRNYDEIM